MRESLTKVPMTNLGRVYADARASLVADVRAVPGGDLRRPVPATPAWTILDVLAHLCGVAADVRHDRLSGFGSDEWTAAQVEGRGDLEAEAIFTEWDEHACVIEQDSFAPIRPANVLLELILGRTGAYGWDWRLLIVSDLTIHRQDILGALDLPVDRSAPGTAHALSFFLHVALSLLVENAGLPALRVVAGEEDLVVGTGQAVGSLTADPYELLRAIAGRRSTAQIGAFEWTTDPAPYLPAFTPFTPPAGPLMER